MQARSSQGFAPVTSGQGTARTPSRLSPLPQPREAPECQLMPVGTGRLVYMLHQISRKSGTVSGARSCRSHLIPLLLPARRSRRRSERPCAAGASPSSAEPHGRAAGSGAAPVGSRGHTELLLWKTGGWERGEGQDTPELGCCSPRLHAAALESGEQKGEPLPPGSRGLKHSSPPMPGQGPAMGHGNSPPHPGHPQH